jgi:hypothetical protein
MIEMQKIISAENRDLFDVLAYIALHFRLSQEKSGPVEPNSP